NNAHRLDLRYCCNDNLCPGAGRVLIEATTPAAHLPASLREMRPWGPDCSEGTHAYAQTSDHRRSSPRGSPASQETLEAMGSIPCRTAMGHRPRGLQQRRHRLGLFSL